jgi:dihydrofolate reductase
MSMSLDGFIAGPGDTKDNPFGTRGHRLHKWLGDGGEDPGSYRPSDEPSRTVFDEMLSTGAVITGRRTGDFVDYWSGDHHDGVPIFVLTHRIDDGDVPPGNAQFVTDVEDCAARARAAAGDRAVMVHGARAAQALLRAGLLDEMEIHVVQVLLGDGRRLFEALGCNHIELELLRRVEARDVTHLRYRIVRS